MHKEESVEKLKENPLDRDRWIEVGKSIGWNKYTEYDCNCGCMKKDSQESWMYHWHRFIDHLAGGGSIDDFFDELIK